MMSFWSLNKTDCNSLGLDRHQRHETDCRGSSKNYSEKHILNDFILSSKKFQKKRTKKQKEEAKKKKERQQENESRLKQPCIEAKVRFSTSSDRVGLVD